MPEAPAFARATPLDKDLKKIARLERAAAETGRSAVRLGLALAFLLAVVLYVLLRGDGFDHTAVVVVAAAVGAYMALNIGANDVANNVGPAVGSQALTLAGAIVIAAIFETAGALIAGGDVVATVSRGIVDPEGFADPQVLILGMLCALLAAALWLNLATWLGAPVSTTHSIVGAVAGSGVAAAGLGAVNWPVMGRIAASWVISPVLGGLIAAGILLVIKVTILYRTDRVAAAKRWVPILVAVMASAFAIYLVMKGLERVWRPGAGVLAAVGIAAFAAAWAIVRPWVRRAAEGLDNRRKSVMQLFTVPLICAAALLSFAHGANDVANAVGPLAAIVGASESGTVQAQVVIPFWVMLVGALGITLGLALFGPRLIRTVGTKITRLDRARAFAIALAAAVTVIAASWLGLPVSSTHIALGALFGVGFLREWLDRRRKPWPQGPAAPLPEWAGAALERSGDTTQLAGVLRREKEKKARKRKLVRRSHLLSIAAAWVITVPLTAMLAAGLFTLWRAVWAG
ncbi:MAG: inorganic phosphate transporter [Alphaproteobacteria bacterium]